MLIHDINNKKRQKHKALLCSWTHSWTVHSGIVFGIWPLFSRLQSTSSPEHAQGGGHVPAWAPHPRCSLRESRKITANPANLRGCGEDHILFYFFSWPLTRERERERERENTPLRSDLRMKRHQFHRVRSHQKTHKTIPNLLPLTAAAAPYIQSEAAVRTVEEKRNRKALFSNSPIPVEKVLCRLRRCCCCCWGNLCSSGSPQHSVSTQQRYAGGRGHRGCLGNVVRAAASELSASGAVRAALRRVWTALYSNYGLLIDY